MEEYFLKLSYSIQRDFHDLAHHEELYAMAVARLLDVSMKVKEQITIKNQFVYEFESKMLENEKIHNL